MSPDIASFGFPLWLRLTHYINFLFLTLLIRSGIQILSDHPRLYWNKHCTPGTAESGFDWIKPHSGCKCGSMPSSYAAVELFQVRILSLSDKWTETIVHIH